MLAWTERFGCYRHGSGTADKGQVLADMVRVLPTWFGYCRHASGTADMHRVLADMHRVSGVGRPLRVSPVGHHKYTLCVCTHYLCERNLSKKEAHGGPGTAILIHLELAVQSTKVPQEPILVTKMKAKKKIPRFVRTDRQYTPLCHASCCDNYCPVMCCPPPPPPPPPPPSQILYPPLDTIGRSIIWDLQNCPL